MLILAVGLPYLLIFRSMPCRRSVVPTLMLGEMLSGRAYEAPVWSVFDSVAPVTVCKSVKDFGKPGQYLRPFRR